MDSAQFWPRFGKIFPLELALSLLVMAIAWAVLTANAEPAFFKARFSEVWIAAAQARHEVIERVVLETPGADEQRDFGRHVSSRRISGSNMTLTGTIGRPYEISFRAVVSEEGTVAYWRCTGTTLPPRLSPSACRR